MKDLVILFEALEKIGYDLDPLSFQDGVGLNMDIKKVIEGYGIKKTLPETAVAG